MSFLWFSCKWICRQRLAQAPAVRVQSPRRFYFFFFIIKLGWETCNGPSHHQKYQNTELTFLEFSVKISPLWLSGPHFCTLTHVNCACLLWVACMTTCNPPSCHPEKPKQSESKSPRWPDRLNTSVQLPWIIMNKHDSPQSSDLGCDFKSAGSELQLTRLRRCCAWGWGRVLHLT